jgi:autophagy-related protein 2
MAYFLPSFFQKRLLRYALSRLELVDTDALDLDSLGIRWGQRSTFELRDVGLKLVVRVWLAKSRGEEMAVLDTSTN